MKNMDKKSKIFFAVFFSVIIIMIGVSFYKYFVLKDYYIQLEADCNPEQEECLSYVCDPADDSECPEVEADRVSHYKLIEKKASAIPF